MADTVTLTREQLRSIEWSSEWRYDYDWTYPCCPACGGLKPHDGGQRDPVARGHTDDCWLAAALATPAPAPTGAPDAQP